MTAITVDAIEREVVLGDAPGDAPPRDMHPRGLYLSGGLHVGALLLIAFGLPALFHRPPMEETPIAVQLVTIAPETRATQPNPYRPRPDAKPDLPIAAPAPKPEPKPEPPPQAAEPPPSASAPPPMPAPPQPPKPEVKAPPPPPPPPVKPVEAQAPPPPPPPVKPQQQLQQIHHAPAPEARKADPAFEKMLKNLEDKKQPQPEPAAFDSLLKNLTKQQTAQVDEPPRQRQKQMALSPPSSQPKAPLGSQLTASEMDALISMIKQQLTPCWNVPAGARDAGDITVEVKASVNADGTVRQATIVPNGRMGDPLYRAAAESARRTFFNPQCTPLKLPADKYEDWKDLDMTFNPKDLL